MATQRSPGVISNEIDLTTVVVDAASSDGAVGGVFRWGPVGERVLIDSENLLVQRFGKPTNFNAETFFTAANFLNYGNRLFVARGANTTGNTPYASFTSAANSTVSNNVFIGNTTGLTAGMFITQTSNSTVMGSGNNITISTVNATAIVLSTNTSVNTAVSLYFGHPGTVYTAVAADSDGATGGIVANLVNQIVKNNENYFASKVDTFDTDIVYVASFYFF